MKVIVIAVELQVRGGHLHLPLFPEQGRRLVLDEDSKRLKHIHAPEETRI